MDVKQHEEATQKQRGRLLLIKIQVLCRICVTSSAKSRWRFYQGGMGVAEVTPKSLVPPLKPPQMKIWTLVLSSHSVYMTLAPPLAHPTPPLEPPQIQMCRTATAWEQTGGTESTKIYKRRISPRSTKRLQLLADRNGVGVWRNKMNPLSCGLNETRFKVQGVTFVVIMTNDDINVARWQCEIICAILFIRPFFSIVMSSSSSSSSS